MKCYLCEKKIKGTALKTTVPGIKDGVVDGDDMVLKEYIMCRLCAFDFAAALDNLITALKNTKVLLSRDIVKEGQG